MSISDFDLIPWEAALLATLAEDEGYDTIDDLIFAVGLSSVQPGICVACEYTVTRIECDQQEGFCDECGEQTVKSVGVLAGII